MEKNLLKISDIFDVVEEFYNYLLNYDRLDNT